MILKSGTRFSSVPFRSAAAALLVAASFAGPAAAQFKKDLPQKDLPQQDLQQKDLQQKDLPPKDLPPITCSSVDSIGIANMAGDGTITLHLKSLWPDAHEDSDLTYAPDDPQYNEIKQHLGGIEPGQSKPIPPFC